MSALPTGINSCEVPVQALRDRRLSRNAIKVLFALACHDLKGDGRCWPKQSRLAQMCAIDRTRVNKAISELIETGYVMILGRECRACCYQILPGPSVPTGAHNEGVKCADGGTGLCAPPRTLECAAGGTLEKSKGIYIPGTAAEDCSGVRPSRSSHVAMNARPSASPARQKPRANSVPDADKPKPPPGATEALIKGAGKAVKLYTPGQSPSQRARKNMSRATWANFCAWVTDIGETPALARFGFDEHGKPKEAGP